MVTTSPSSELTFHSSSSTKATHSRPPLGGNVGGANGGVVPPTSAGAPTSVPSTTTPTPFTSPTSTVQTSGVNGANRSSNVASKGFNSAVESSSSPTPSDLFAGSSLSSPTFTFTSFFPSTSGDTQVDGSINLAGPTITQGDSSVTTTSDSAVVTSSNAPKPTGPLRDMSSGIIAGIIAVLIFCILFLGICIHRKRKAKSAETDTSSPKDGTTAMPVHSPFKESGLVFANPHSASPTPTLSTPPRSPRWLADSNSDISQLSLPPPPMVEINDQTRTVPTLVLDTSRYRRSHQSGPIDSRLSVVTADSHRHSRGRRQSRSYADDGSPTSATRSWSPSEAFCSSKPPVSFGSLSRPSSQTSFSPPSSPTYLRVPPSPTGYLRPPPSPRTPTRVHSSLPPIPPVPKSPPPVPGSYSGPYINPFVSRDPFDDPSG